VSWLPGNRFVSQSFPELRGHFIFSITQRAGADDFALMACGSAAGFHIDAAELADAQGLPQQKGNAAKGEIARLDLMNRAGARTVKDGKGCLALNEPAWIAAAIASGKNRRGRNNGGWEFGFRQVVHSVA
jgi:hypothetical protein